MRLHLEPFSVTVVCYGPAGPERTGSGTCVQIGDRFLIATAAHIVDGYSGEHITLVHTSAPSRRKVRITRLGTAGGLTPNALFDLAWLELDTADALAMEKRFVPIERLGLRPPQEPVNVVVVGFPLDLIDPALRAQKVLCVQPLSYSTLTKAAETFPPGRFEHTDLFFDVPADANVTNAGAPARMPAALGLSGAGMWHLDINRSGLWSPEFATLIGVQRTANSTDGWLRGTPIVHWLRLVRTGLVELAPIIDARLFL